MEVWMMKKKLMSVTTGALLLAVLAFSGGASAAQTDPGIGTGGGGTVPKPICTNNGHCYYP